MTKATQRRKYKNPPIEEALVEFRFVPSQEWDLTIPGKLHQHPAIKDNYPGKPRQQKVVEAAFQTGIEQPPSFAVREGIGRIQLLNDDGKRLLSLGPDVLSVNILRPYDNWENFRPRVEAALTAYRDVANPKAVSRVGVRYINKVTLPKVEIDLGTYFCYRPPTASGLPDRMAGFMSRVEYVYYDGVKLILTQASIEAPTGSSAFLLDLDTIWEGPEPLSLDAVMATVDVLHEREGVAFEATITDEARKVFDAS